MCLPRVSGCEVVNLESGHVRERGGLGSVIHGLERGSGGCTMP